MSDLVIQSEISAGIFCLTLNRSPAYNALSTDLMQALYDQLDALESNPDCKVAIICGSGKGFCAGHDLKEVQAITSHERRLALFQLCSKMMLKVRAVRFPVIAQVHGIATAAGCQLVASCDLAVAAEDARFSTPGVNIGLFCSTPMVAVSRNVSAKQTMEMLLTGEFVSAKRAIELGLINRMCTPDDLKTETQKLAATIADKAPRILAIGKQAFYRQLEMPIEDAYKFASEVMAANADEPDAIEGIGAFVQKRRPVWQV